MMRLPQFQPHYDLPEGLEIKPMSESDLDEVMEIEQVSFPSPWSRSSYEAELNQNSLSIYLVARSQEKVIGYAGMWVIFDEGHITNVAIHPQVRNQGLGYLLMSELIRTAIEYRVQAITLEVRPSNRSAQALYRRLGFAANGLRKGYYTDSGEDAIIMWKYIIPPKKVDRS